MFRTAALGTVVPSLLIAKPLNAESKVDEAGAAVAADATAATESLVSSLTTAIRTGDTQGLMDILGQFLLPAAVALIVLFMGYFVASFFGRVVGGSVSKRVDVTFGKFLGKILKNGLLILLLLGVLGYFGIDVTSFAAIIAALGFAVGMALQGTLGNFAAGIMLLVFRPFKVGDYIQVGGESGTVEEVDLFATRLNTADNLHKIVPNGQIFGATITNYSRNDLRRVDVSVGADYEADIDYTRAVLETAISEIPGAVPEPAAQVVLKELADSSVNWQIRVWCEPADYWSVRELVTVAAKKGMDLNGVGIPYPQLEIHLPSPPAAARKAA